MSLVLDAQTEQRIQLIHHALDVLASKEAWTEEDKAELDLHLAESIARIERDEGIPGNKVREVPAQMRAARGDRTPLNILPSCTVTPETLNHA